MADHSEQSEVKIVSYNMHGYKQGSVLLPTLCKDFKIIFLQEHWLLPDDLDKIEHLTNMDFVCFSKSAMDSRICSGVLAGRPYGGMSILVHKSLSTCVKCIAKRDRFIVLSIGDVVYVNVYFPVKKSDDMYKNELICLLEDIAATVSQTGLDKVVLGGDFNFQCDELSTGFSLLKKCLKDLDLVCCAVTN